MKRIILTALCALLITGPAYAAESFDEAAAAEMAKMFPKTIIDGFSPSPVSGLYEVTAGSQIFYFTPEGYLVFGEIWSKDGKKSSLKNSKILK
jgi:thiol:disulfide interchange protein DsbC